LASTKAASTSEPTSGGAIDGVRASCSITRHSRDICTQLLCIRESDSIPKQRDDDARGGAREREKESEREKEREKERESERERARARERQRERDREREREREMCMRAPRVSLT
jgi:hypothetical protein